MTTPYREHVENAVAHAQAAQQMASGPENVALVAALLALTHATLAVAIATDPSHCQRCCPES